MFKNHQNNRDEFISKSIGKVNFIEKRNKKYFNLVIKGLSFILIAAISGGISGAYVSSRRNSSVIYPRIAGSKTILSGEDTKDNNNTKSEITRTIDKVASSVVSVNFQGDNNRQGNGIIFKPEGYILTNYHIVKDAGEINVFLFKNNDSMSAKLIGFDEKLDLAVIKIQGENLPYAVLGDVSKARIGDQVLAVGNSINKNEFYGSVSSGIISVTNKNVNISDSRTCKVFLTDALMDQGNAGGPLCNLNGEVIGINCLNIGGYTGNIDGLAFAISIEDAQKSIDSIINTNSTAKAQLGIKAVTLEFHNKNLKGVYVQEIVINRSSDNLALKPTDVIVEIDGIKVSEYNELKNIVVARKVGETVKLKVWRNDSYIDLDVILTEESDNNL